MPFQMSEIGTFDLTAYASPLDPQREKGRGTIKVTNALGERVRVAKPRAPRPVANKRPGHGPHCLTGVALRGADGTPSLWWAQWRDQRSLAGFTSEAQARAFLASCDLARKLRY